MFFMLVLGLEKIILLWVLIKSFIRYFLIADGKHTVLDNGFNLFFFNFIERKDLILRKGQEKG